MFSHSGPTRGTCGGTRSQLEACTAHTVSPGPGDDGRISEQGNHLSRSSNGASTVPGYAWHCNMMLHYSPRTRQASPSPTMVTPALWSLWDRSRPQLWTSLGRCTPAKSSTVPLIPTPHAAPRPSPANNAHVFSQTSPAPRFRIAGLRTANPRWNTTRCSCVSCEHANSTLRRHSAFA